MSDHLGNTVRDLRELAEKLHSDAYKLEETADVIETMGADEYRKDRKEEVAHAKKRAREYIK